jgi:hypothetical protein
MTCNNCYNPSCDSTCGCPQQVKGSCVFYQGANLTCLDVTKGDDYDSILASLNTLICDLVAPSGNTTIVTSNACSGGNNILVTSSTVGSTTTYNVCLNQNVLDDIEANTIDIATLSACVNSGVLDLVSNDGSVSINVDTPSTGCGVILDLSVPVPSGLPVVDGIIYSNTVKEGTIAGTGGDEVLTESPATGPDSIGNYYTSYGLEVGDEIRWRANGQIQASATNADKVKFDLFDGVTGILNGNIFGSFSTDSVTSSWEMEATAIVTDNTPGASEVLIDAKFFQHSKPNGIVNNGRGESYLFNQTISNIDLSSLQVRIKYLRQAAGVSASDNFARQLVVEIRKKLTI